MERRYRDTVYDAGLSSVIQVGVCMVYTGYFSNVKKYKKLGFCCISVAQFNPSWYNGVSFPELAPSQTILAAYKLQGMSVEEYERLYLKELERPEAVASMEKLKNKALTDSRDLILLCYEKPKDFCHRHILARQLNNKYPDVFSISEYQGG